MGNGETMISQRTAEGLPYLPPSLSSPSGSGVEGRSGVRRKAASPRPSPFSFQVVEWGDREGGENEIT